MDAGAGFRRVPSVCSDAEARTADAAGLGGVRRLRRVAWAAGLVGAKRLGGKRRGVLGMEDWEIFDWREMCEKLARYGGL